MHRGSREVCPCHLGREMFTCLSTPSSVRVRVHGGVPVEEPSTTPLHPQSPIDPRGSRRGVTSQNAQSWVGWAVVRVCRSVCPPSSRVSGDSLPPDPFTTECLGGPILVPSPGVHILFHPPCPSFIGCAGGVPLVSLPSSKTGTGTSGGPGVKVSVAHCGDHSPSVVLTPPTLPSGGRSVPTSLPTGRGPTESDRLPEEGSVLLL